ncbi:HAD family hydrolase [Chitinispirillales bacterium ANBcel5]|uniref:HAD family hydrolase n=1 Tax=Cellulosispirillum alkaliphilum TaxID=3039283 RepID=UPI002A576DFA|nr:HAD family hydrolase [Chitinispirillales bacterium ANBcel5]
MSQLAEYAAKLHQKEAYTEPKELNPIYYQSSQEQLSGIRAVIFDVYGTLINYWRPGFETPQMKEKTLSDTFSVICEKFGMGSTFAKINPQQPPEKTLSEFYHGLIVLSQEKAQKSGNMFAEVKIEEVWNLILLMLKRHGYKAEHHCPGDCSEFNRYLAFTYNFHALGRQLYPNVYTALKALKEKHIVLGIVSNAQFYTPIDLTLMLRDQSGGEIDDYYELFDVDLVFYSYEYGVRKPGELLFRKLFDALYEMHILPSQTLFVGNDLVMDIEPASSAGMKTAFFTGDQNSAYFHDKRGTIIPDLCINDYEELPPKVSFHGE